MHNDPSSGATPRDAVVPTVSCDAMCSQADSIEELNRGCFCVAVDPDDMRDALAVVMAAHGMPDGLSGSHANLFASLPVYVPDADVGIMGRVAGAIEVAVARPSYRTSALAWAPEIAHLDPGSPGGLLGLDFHLGVDGPKLIEINTNPGGLLLNALMGKALRVCMPDRVRVVLPAAQAEDDSVRIVKNEWRLQRGDAPLRTVAIVDEAPESQYLFPEFLLFRELLRRHDVDAVICDPAQLERHRDGCAVAGRPIDLIHNRLTDFPLSQPGHRMLKEAYLAGAVALSPHPRAHAIYADKRNLALLGDRGFLERAGCDSGTAKLLSATIPRTRLVSEENRAELWSGRKEYCFKPAAGFGSKASYRGDKITRRVWEEMRSGVYVAQEIVVPGARHVTASGPPLKADIRCYAYRGQPVMFAARLYQGQTTNFRTPGGGFAPVLTLSGGCPTGAE